MSRVPVLIVPLLLACASAPQPIPATANLPTTAPTDAEIAQSVDLLALHRTMDRLDALGAGGDWRARIETRQELLGEVLAASAEADEAISRIQDEQALVRELEASLQSEHDTRVTWLNVSAGILGAGAAVGTGLTLKDSTNDTGIWITTITSGVAAIITTAAALWPTKGRGPIHSNLAMLAPLLDPNAAPTGYPPRVWRFLVTPTSATPGAKSPRQRLLDEWLQLGTIQAPGPSSLTRPLAPSRSLTGDELATRELMLGDVRAQVSSFRRVLGAILERGWRAGQEPSH